MFVSPHSCKICINKHINAQQVDLLRTHNEPFVLCTLQVQTQMFQGFFVRSLGRMSVTTALSNSEVNVWSTVSGQIQQHATNRTIVVCALRFQSVLVRSQSTRFCRSSLWFSVFQIQSSDDSFNESLLGQFNSTVVESLDHHSKKTSNIVFHSDLKFRSISECSNCVIDIRLLVSKEKSVVNINQTDNCLRIK